jgi:hypothetical protein
LLQPFLQLDLDALDRVEHGLARRDVVRRRIDREARDPLPHPAGQRVEQLQAIDLVVQKLHPHREFGMLGREDVDRVAAHTERAARELGLVAAVLHRRQPCDHVALAQPVMHAQRQHHRVVVVRVADAVDRRYRRHDHRVAPLQQALGGRQPHLLDVLVDAAVLFDVQVAGRDVGLGLVIVVIRDEVLHRVVREELPHLRVQLRGKRLVGRQHQTGAADPGDDVGHRVGLARPRHAQERLECQPILKPLGQAFDCLRLVASRRKRLVQLEWGVGEGQKHGSRAPQH